MGNETCEYCGREVENYNSILISSEDVGNGNLTCICLHCYNKNMADAVGINYDHIELQPIYLDDYDGIQHKFHFTIRLMGEQLALSSFEITEDGSDGYRFEMIGNIEDGIFSVFSRLYERMLKNMGRQHVYKSKETGSWQISMKDYEEDIVRGYMTSDSEADAFDVPLVVIDGKPFTWTELGRMLMSFEGANFKLQMFDPSDDVD